MGWVGAQPPSVHEERAHGSRIPPACGLEHRFMDLVTRWFSLAKPRFTTGYLPYSLREWTA